MVAHINKRQFAAWDRLSVLTIWQMGPAVVNGLCAFSTIPALAMPKNYQNVNTAVTMACYVADSAENAEGEFCSHRLYLAPEARHCCL
jgi:hypothetical protein